MKFPYFILFLLFSIFASYFFTEFSMEKGNPFRINLFIIILNFIYLIILYFKESIIIFFMLFLSWDFTNFNLQGDFVFFDLSINNFDFNLFLIVITLLLLFKKIFHSYKYDYIDEMSFSEKTKFYKELFFKKYPNKTEEDFKQIFEEMKGFNLKKKNKYIKNKIIKKLKKND